MGLAGVLRVKRSGRLPSAGKPLPQARPRQTVGSAERPDQLWWLILLYVSNNGGGSVWRGGVHHDAFAGYIGMVGIIVHGNDISCWMRWSRRCGPVVRPAPSITAIKAQYASLAHMERLKKQNWLASTGVQATLHDNAMAESINGL